MTDKITIRARSGGWHVTRPGYGFTPPSTTVYPTWEAARDSLTKSLGAGGALAEKGAYTLGVWNRYWPARPRWIEAT